MWCPRKEGGAGDGSLVCRELPGSACSTCAGRLACAALAKDAQGGLRSAHSAWAVWAVRLLLPIIDGFLHARIPINYPVSYPLLMDLCMQHLQCMLGDLCAQRPVCASPVWSPQGMGWMKGPHIRTCSLHISNIVDTYMHTHTPHITNIFNTHNT